VSGIFRPPTLSRPESEGQELSQQLNLIIVRVDPIVWNRLGLGQKVAELVHLSEDKLVLFEKHIGRYFDGVISTSPENGFKDRFFILGHEVMATRLDVGDEMFVVPYLANPNAIKEDAHADCSSYVIRRSEYGDSC
jgi:hypothetical protein